MGVCIYVFRCCSRVLLLLSLLCFRLVFILLSCYCVVIHVVV